VGGVFLRLPERLRQRFEQRRHALGAAERRGDLLVDDDGLEGTPGLLEILATSRSAFVEVAALDGLWAFLVDTKGARRFL
jgi:hypothetical protein